MHHCLKHYLLCLPLLLFALCLRPAVQAQTLSGDCPPRYSAFFPSPEDSLAWSDMHEDFQALDSLFSITREDTVLHRAAQAAEALLAFSQKVFADHAHPALLIAWKYAAELRLSTLEETTEAAQRTADSLCTVLFPCETRLSTELRSGRGIYAWVMNDYARAESLFVFNATALRGLSVTDSAAIAKNQYWLGMTLARSRQHAKAVAAFDEAMKLYRAMHDSSSVADCLYYLASEQFSMQDFDGSERSYRSMVEITRALHGAASGETIDALQELCGYYERCGLYDEAKQTIMLALEAARRPGADVPALSLWNLNTTLARVLESGGESGEVENCHREALLQATRIGQDFGAQAAAITHNNLALYYERRGDHGRALQHLQLTRDVVDSLPDQPTMRLMKAKVLGSFGIVYRSLERYGDAESSYLQAIEIIELETGTDAYELVYPLGNLALMYKDIGRAEEGLPLQHRAIGLVRGFWGNDHPMLGVLLRNLASIELTLGMDDSAAVHLTQALTMLERWYDERNPELQNCLYAYAQWIERHPDAPESTSIMRRLVEGTIKRMRDSFAFESEEQQLRVHQDIVRKHLAVVARWAARKQAPTGSAEILSTGIMALKGAILSENVRLNASMHAHEQEQRVFNALTEAREQFASLAARPVDENEGSMRALRTQLLQRIDSLDAALRRINSMYARHRDVEDASVRDIQRRLGRDEAVIEFLAVVDSLNSRSRRYLALVIAAGQPAKLYSLCSEHELGIALHMAGDGVMVSLMPEETRMRRLYELIWSPLAEALTTVRTISIVPDGVLHRVPFAALLPDDAATAEDCLDTRYELHHLTGSRQLLARSVQQLRRDETSPFVLLGNPSFTAPGQTVDPGKPGWKTLPGTHEELQRIVRLCDSLGIATRVLEQHEASESKMKLLSEQGSRVLHLATHGFFFPVLPLNDDTRSTQLDVSRGRSYLAAAQHPLLRSGLILAHANSVWTGSALPPNAEDGILTALEVSRLNLTGTELVVLSACETALGDIRTGEGVFGLQRAFFSAGAESLVMSLWKVPDQLTALFMEEFYRAWLAGVSKVDAMRKARRSMRARSADPRIWAAFVLVGE
jgi:CHAT domain-containing protein